MSTYVPGTSQHSRAYDTQQLLTVVLGIVPCAQILDRTCRLFQFGFILTSSNLKANNNQQQATDVRSFAFRMYNPKVWIAHE